MICVHVSVLGSRDLTNSPRSFSIQPKLLSTIWLLILFTILISILLPILVPILTLLLLRISLHSEELSDVGPSLRWPCDDVKSTSRQITIPSTQPQVLHNESGRSTYEEIANFGKPRLNIEEMSATHTDPVTSVFSALQDVQ
jgi:hypothetical protein